MSTRAARIVWIIGQIGAICLISFLSLPFVKGWSTLLLLPLLLPVIPLIIAAQVKLHLRLKEGVASLRLGQLAAVQLVSIVVFYLCFPGADDQKGFTLTFTDGNRLDRLINDYAAIPCVLAAGAFVSATIQFFRAARRKSDRSEQSQ